MKALNVILSRFPILAALTVVCGNSFGQFVYTFTDGSSFTYSSSPGTFDASGYERARQAQVDRMNKNLGDQLDAARFDQKLLISAGAVQVMDIERAKPSKYTYVDALYKKSIDIYKELGSISAAAAAAVRAGQPIGVFEDQENQVMNEAVEYYHKGEYVEELGERSAELIKEEKMAFIGESCLSSEEKSQYNVIKSQIKDMQAKISQLHHSGQTMAQMRDQLNTDYHTLFQALNAEATVTEDVIKLFAPAKAVKIVNVSEAAIKTYIEEAYAEGKPPGEAIEKALQEGFKELIKKEKDEHKLPSEKREQATKVIFDDIRKEAANWEEMDRERTETMEKINETIELTDDLVRRNQQLVEAAARKGEALTQRCIDDYVHHRLN
jgi:hypothetical protein